MWYDYVCVIGVQGESMPTNTVQAVSPYYNPTIEEVSTVPNIKSAKKRVKFAAAKTLQNKMINSQLKTEIKKANAAIESNADKAELSRSLLRESTRLLQRVFCTRIRLPERSPLSIRS